LTASSAAELARGEYATLGTLEVRTWRRGLSGTVTSDEVADTMADFKAHMRVDVSPRHWKFITARAP
jgi:hypothetical protein